MGTLVASASALFIFIHSYLQVNDSLSAFVKKYQVEPGQFQDTQTWVIILLLSILVAVTLFGSAMIFIYYQKLFALYRFQQNFINGFTHELKTPIASLRLYLDTFKKYDLNKDEQKKYLDYMVADTERLTLNVNQILQIAKIEDKNFRPSFVETKLYSFFEDFYARNPHYFEEASIEITNSNSFDYTLEIEPKLFEMVIMNIVTNAINYNRNQTPRLTITFELHGNELVIDFKDNGIGMDKKEFKNVFKKMYQIGKSAKGSGLGLYLTAMIIKIHRGKIYVTSEGPGMGSTFTIRLPYKRSR